MKAIELRNEVLWIPEKFESETLLMIASTLNTQLKLISFTFPEKCNLQVSRKIYAPNLEYLFVEGKGAKGFIENLDRYFSPLTSLKGISINRIGLTKIPDWVLALKNLKEISIRGEGITYMPAEIFLMKQLESLHLQYTKEISQVPDDIEQLQHLENFSLWKANLQYLSAELFRLPQIKFITFKSSRFEGKNEVLSAVDHFRMRQNTSFTPWENFSA